MDHERRRQLFTGLAYPTLAEQLFTGLAYPALAEQLFTRFERGRGPGTVPSSLGLAFAEAIDYALVHSKAPTEYLEALLDSVDGDYYAAILVFRTAQYGHRHKIDPAYIGAVLMLPFAVDGRSEDDRVENRVIRLYEAGVPAEYASALRECALTVAEVIQYWQDGVSAEYVVAAV